MFLVKSAIKLSLPQIKTKLSFHLKLDNGYYTREKYRLWEKSNFQPDAFHFQGMKIHQLRQLSFLDKKRNKGKYLKIKLLCNELVPNPTDLEDQSELFPVKRDVIIFVTGGGFVSDFEKIAQYYLREISKDLSMPVFIIKYRWGLLESPLWWCFRVP